MNTKESAAMADRAPRTTDGRNRFRFPGMSAPEAPKEAWTDGPEGRVGGEGAARHIKNVREEAEIRSRYTFEDTHSVVCMVHSVQPRPV